MQMRYPVTVTFTYRCDLCGKEDSTEHISLAQPGPVVGSGASLPREDHYCSMWTDPDLPAE